MTVGENIKRVRIEKGLTQKQLGDLCHMADSAIRRYELGKANPKIETIKRIASALGVDYNQLIDMNKISITKDLITKRPDIREALTQGMLEVLGASADKRLIELIKNDNSDKFINIFNSIIERVDINEKYRQLQITLVDIDKKHLLESFNKLNSIGRDEAIKRVEELTEIPRYTQEEIDKPFNMVNAAHADDYSNAPDKLKQQEEDIMNDDNF